MRFLALPLHLAALAACGRGGEDRPPGETSVPPAPPPPAAATARPPADAAPADTAPDASPASSPVSSPTRAPALEERPLPAGARARLGGTAFTTVDDIRAIAASPDGRFIAAHDEGNVTYVWDATTGRQLLASTAPGPSSDDVQLAFAGDRLIASAGRAMLDVIALPSGAHERALAPCGKHAIADVAVSPDGTRLAVACAGSTALPIVPLRGGRGVAIRSTGEGRAVAWAPDGRQIAVARDEDVLLVEVASRAPRATLALPRGSAIAFAPDGASLAIQDDGITLHDLTANVQRFHEKPTIVGDAAFARDGSLVYAPWMTDHTLVVVDPRTGASTPRMPSWREAYALAAGPGGMWVGVDQCVRQWDLTSDAEVTGPAGHCGGVRSLAFSPDGASLASGSHDGTIRIWDLATRASRRALAPTTTRMQDVYAVAWSTDGRTVFDADITGTVRTWDVASGAMRSERTDLQRPIYGMVLVNAGRLGVAIGSDQGHGRVIAFDTVTGAQVRSFDASTQGLARSSDGGRIAFAAADGVHVIDSTTGALVATLPRKDAVVVALSRDGSRVAVSGEARTDISIFDVGGSSSIEWRSATSASALAFTSDDRLVVGRLDGSLGITSIGRSPPAFHAAHRGAVRALALSPDGTQLASGGHEGEILLWPL